MLNVGDMIGRMGVDLSGFTGGLLKAEGMTNVFGSKISTFLANPLLGVIGAAKDAAGAIISLVSDTAAAADEFSKLSQQTGMSIEMLSGLDHAAKISGASTGSLQMAMRKLVSTASDADKGVAGAKDKFAALGISIYDAGGNLKNMDELFLTVADSVKGIEDPMQRAAAVQGLFGDRAAELTPLLAEGRDGINGLVGEAKALGLTFDETSGKAAEKFNDSLARLKGAATGLARQFAVPIFTALAPVFETLAEKAGKLLGPMLTSVGKIMHALAPVIGELVATIGDALAPVMEALTEIWEALAPAMEPVFKLLGAVAKIVGAVLAPALKLLAPILSHIAQVLAVLIEGITWVLSKVGDGLGWLGKKLGLGGDENTAASAGGETTVNVLVSPEDSADAVSRKLAPKIAESVGATQRRIESGVDHRMREQAYSQNMAWR